MFLAQLMPLYVACCDGLLMVQGSKGDYNGRAWTRVERMLGYNLCRERSFFWLERPDGTSGRMPGELATIGDPAEGKLSVPADRDTIDFLIEAAETAAQMDGGRTVDFGTTRVEVKNLADEFRPLDPPEVGGEYAVERRVFAALDRRGDGRVRRAALLQAVKEDSTARARLGLGSDDTAEDDDQILESVFQSVGAGATGDITFDEFRAYMDACRHRIVARAAEAAATPAPTASKSWTVWPWSASPAAQPSPESVPTTPLPAPDPDHDDAISGSRPLSPLHSEVLRQNELIRSTIEHLQSLIDPARESPAYLRTLRALEARREPSPGAQFARPPQAPVTIERTTSMGFPSRSDAGVSDLSRLQAEPATNMASETYKAADQDADTSSWNVGRWLRSSFSPSSTPVPADEPVVLPETAIPKADIGIGSSVEVYSKSSLAWVVATVQDVQAEMIKVQYQGPNGKPLHKHVRIDAEGDVWRRISGSTAQPSSQHAPPEPVPTRPVAAIASSPEPEPQPDAQVSQRLAVGTAVQVYSRSSGGWLPATVRSFSDADPSNVKLAYVSQTGRNMEKMVSRDALDLTWRLAPPESESSVLPSEEQVLLGNAESAAPSVPTKSTKWSAVERGGRYSRLPEEDRAGPPAPTTEQQALISEREPPDVMSQVFILIAHLQTFALLLFGPALVQWPSEWLEACSWVRYVTFEMENVAPPLVAFVLALTLPALVMARAVFRLWLCDDSQFSDMERREWREAHIEQWPKQRNGLIVCWIVAPCVLTATVLAAEDTGWSKFLTLDHSEDLLPVFGTLCCIIGYALGACFGTGYSGPIISRLFSRTALITLCVSMVLALACHLFYLLYYHQTPFQSAQMGSAWSNSTGMLTSADDRGIRVLRYLAASVIIALPTVFGVRRCFRSFDFVSLAVRWTRETHETVMTCCGLVPYDERMRSAMVPSVLLGAWIFVSGIWDVPDEHLAELQHPFAAGACTIAVGCVMYGLISLGTGSSLLRLWREKRLRNIDEDIFFKRWAFREFSVLVVLFFVAHVPAMALSLHYISIGYAGAPVLNVVAWFAGPFYVAMPAIVVAIAASNLRRRVLLEYALAATGPSRLRKAVRTLTGRWRVVGRDVHGRHVIETVILRCTTQKIDGGERKIVVEGSPDELDERAEHEPFTLMDGELTEERGVVRVRFTQQYYTQVKSADHDPETGAAASYVTQANEEDTTVWDATLTHCHCHGNDSTPRLHGWWSGNYKQIPFHRRFHASKTVSDAPLTSDSAAFRDSVQTSAVEEAPGHVSDVITDLTDDEYEAALMAGVTNTYASEPHVASAMPLVNQFKQTAWMMMPLQIVEQTTIASVLYGCPRELRLRVCTAIMVTGWLFTVVYRPYRSADANWTIALARTSNLLLVLLGLSIDQRVLSAQAGLYLLFGDLCLMGLILLGSFAPMRLLSASVQRCHQVRRGIAETRELFADDVATAMSDSSTLEYWQRQRSVEGQPLARFQHTVRSCCHQVDRYALDNLEMLDLRSLGVLEQHTKRELAALLCTARCEHLLTLRAVLVEDRANGVTLDVTNEGRQMPLQNQNLGPDDVQLVAGWLCSRVPAEKLASVDLSRNFVFGRKDLHCGEEFSPMGTPLRQSVRTAGVDVGRSGDLQMRVHTVDECQTGWTDLTAALQESGVGSLILCGIGMGPIGLRSLAKALLDGLRCLETLDLSENYLRDSREIGSGKGSVSLKAFSAFCHALVGTGVKRLDLACCGIDAAALGFLPEPPVDAAGVKSAKDLSAATGARYPLSNSPVLQLRSLNLRGNPLTNSEPYHSTALENYAPRDLRYPSSQVKTELRLDGDLIGLHRLCHALSKSRLLTRLDLSACRCSV